MSKPSVEDYDRLSQQRDLLITKEQLPLFCPSDDQATWCAHPRVFLPIEGSEQQMIRCPYCGTHYSLVKS